MRQPCVVRQQRRTPPRTVARAGAAQEGADAAAPYRVRVDLDLCQGHGVCLNEAPRVFDLDRNEMKVRLENPDPGPEERAAVEAAVKHCPTRAIRIE